MQKFGIWVILSVLFRVCAYTKSVDSIPALPTETVETKLSSTPSTGRKILVQVTSDIYENGRALQKAIDEAFPGDRVLLPPAIYVCGSCELRKKIGVGWNTIEAATADERLPPEGTRISPTNEKFMPVIVSPGFNIPPIKTESGANHWRLIGLEITKLDPKSFVQEMLVIDADGNRAPGIVADLTDFPSHIIVDRCYIHGLPSADMKRGIRLYCRWCAVIDSYIADAHVVGQEAQAILFGGGPLKISNNYLEGAGENLFAQDYLSLRSARFLTPPTATSAIISRVDDLSIGDGVAIWDGNTRLFTHIVSIAGSQIQYEPLSMTPAVTAIMYWGKVPTDIEVYHNYLFKPLNLNPNHPSYAGYHANVKNLFELKSGRRVWVHDNVLQNVWLDGQDGTAILFTVRNQTGDCYFCAVEDVTFEKNVVINAFNGINVLATDYNAISGPTRNILIRNNLFLDIIGSFQENTIEAEIVDRNTILIGGYAMSVEKGACRQKNQFSNNVVMSKWASGYHYNDGAPPDWHSIFPGLFFDSNVFSRIDGLSAYFYMPDYASRNFEVDSPEDVGFVDWSNENLALAPTSWASTAGTDGGAIGADVAMLMALRADVESGITTRSPSLSSPSRARRSPPGLSIESFPTPPVSEMRTGPTMQTTRSASLNRGAPMTARASPKAVAVLSTKPAPANVVILAAPSVQVQRYNVMSFRPSEAVGNEESRTKSARTGAVVRSKPEPGPRALTRVGTSDVNAPNPTRPHDEPF